MPLEIGLLSLCVHVCVGVWGWEVGGGGFEHIAACFHSIHYVCLHTCMCIHVLCYDLWMHIHA